MEIKNVTITGAGTLGSQIAWQTAFKGFNVTVFDTFEKGLEKCKAAHNQYANLIWDYNIGEVMGHPDTDPQIFNRVVKFAEEIGMVPIPIHKEQNGYVINTLLMPFLSAGLTLLYTGVADVESIDKTWMIATGAPSGPCAIMDVIGMQTIYNVDILWGEKLGDQNLLNRADWIKKNYMDKGKMGMDSGIRLATFMLVDFEMHFGYKNEDNE